MIHNLAPHLVVNHTLQAGNRKVTRLSGDGRSLLTTSFRVIERVITQPFMQLESVMRE
jgi:hypothetical protein